MEILLSVGQVFAQYQNVQPVDWSKYVGMTGIQPGDTFGQDINTILNNESRYLYSWVNSNYQLETYKYFNDVPGYYGGSLDGDGVRPLAHFAWGNAVMLRTGTYDPTITQLQESVALERTEYAIRGVAMTHMANRPDSSGWGQGTAYGTWQGAYWASRGAQAGWMLWDLINTETKTAVANMVKHEADHFINYTVPYWRNPDGSTNFPGDTKAEENAWNSRVLTIAQAMMPDDPNVDLWRRKASELMVSSYSRESDIDNTILMDGKPVNEWIHGYNTFDDGVLVNHNRAHPGYMTVHTLTFDTLVDTSLAGQYIPESAFFNDQVNWNATTELNFVVGANPYGTGLNLPPGGTIFNKKPDGTLDPTPYFPNGDDWSSNPAADVNYVLHLVYGAVRNLDTGQEVDAMDWAQVEVDALRNLQLRSGHDGNIYENGDWASDRDGNEIDTYRELSESWLVHWLDQHNQLSPISNHWGELAISGDFDSDGDVDAADLLAWRAGFGLATDADLTDGDTNADGDVDGADFLVWQRHFDASSLDAESAVAAVPEPATMILLIGFVAVCLGIELGLRKIGCRCWQITFL
ncbi:MAG: hypothetical protein JW829_06615 [Pirellulales bacterium]|nr:hypothetical protein [Pirellulales bacterium]